MNLFSSYSLSDHPEPYKGAKETNVEAKKQDSVVVVVGRRQAATYEIMRDRFHKRERQHIWRALLTCFMVDYILLIYTSIGRMQNTTIVFKTQLFAYYSLA